MIAYSSQPPNLPATFPLYLSFILQNYSQLTRHWIQGKYTHISILNTGLVFTLLYIKKYDAKNGTSIQHELLDLAIPNPFIVGLVKTISN